MANIELRTSVRDAIQKMVDKIGLKQPQWTVSEASQNGDNFSGHVYRVHVIETVEKDEANGNKKSSVSKAPATATPAQQVINFIDWCYNSLSSAPTELRIIAKLSPSDAFRRHAYSSTEHFAREKYTFETLLPAFTAFETRAANACPAADKISPPYKAFDSYPTVLAASDTEFDEYILLKDLKAEGFRNHERTQPLDEQHIRVVLERLAHFHAISFAYRYREPVAFKALTARLREIMFVRPVKPEMQSFLEPSVAFVLDALREIAPEERELVDRIDAFRDVYVDSMASCTDAAWSDEGIADECAVLHGDCWISNLMFRRQGGCGGGDDAAADNNEAPLDVKFVDWQVTRYGSVAVDLSYFLFCCTDETTRRNIDEKLCIYHEALVRRIAVLLGGGPDNDDIAANMMPMARLRWHMKKYARFGLGMSIMMLHAITCPSEQIPNIQDTLARGGEDPRDELFEIGVRMAANPVYKRRIVGVVRDCVRYQYI